MGSSGGCDSTYIGNKCEKATDGGSSKSDMSDSNGDGFGGEDDVTGVDETGAVGEVLGIGMTVMTGLGRGDGPMYRLALTLGSLLATSGGTDG